MTDPAKQEPIIYYFPTDRSMGQLWIDGKDSHVEAIGVVKVPRNKDLVLVISDEASVDLSPLATLKSTDVYGINLGGTAVSGAGLAHLKGLTSLLGLSLDFTKVSNVGLAHLKGLTSLQKLGLGFTKVSDAGLAHLKGLTSLQSLSLYGTKTVEYYMGRRNLFL